MLSQLQLVYVLVVGSIGLGLLVASLVWLRRTANRRRQRFEDRDRSDPVRTASPVDDPARLTRRRGLASIETHFTVTRRLVIPLLLVVTGVALLVPFLDQISGATLSLLVAALTVVAGVAARPVVENAIAGLVISSSKLVNLGDTVRVNGFYGTVEDITTTHTTIRVWDWRRYVISNGAMLQTEFVNYSLHDTYQWAYVEFWVAYDADLDRVEEVARAAPERSSHYAAHEAPRFWIMEMAKEGYRCWLAAWANSPADAWVLTHDVRSELIRAFQAAGIRTHGYRLHDGDELVAPRAPEE